MGKIRTVKLGDEQSEKEQAKKADARREAKKAKKTKSEDVVEKEQVVEAPKETSEKPQEPSKKQKVRSKRYQEALQLVDRSKLYPIAEAIALVKKTSLTKFDGTVEVHINLNSENLGGKNEFRGTVNFPHTTGKQVKVAIVDDAVLKEIGDGKINFDVLIAHPSMMAKIARFARVLGPKGLMPNPKNGTVTDNPEKRAQELSGGQVNFKTEQNNPILHLGVGKVSHEEKYLRENIKALIDAVGSSKILNVTLTSTMGPGIKLDVTLI